MKLVTQTEVLAERLGDEKAIRLICESGFDGIDFSMFRMSEDDDLLNASGYKNLVREIKKIAESYSVTFEQSHAPFPSIRKDDSEYNAKTFERIKRALEIAGMLDAKICVIHPSALGSDQFERNIEFYQKLEPYAKNYGVKIALENMWGGEEVDGVWRKVRNICSDTEDFNRYVDALNPEHFTACLDLGHCGLVGEDAAEMIRGLGHDRLGALHIHDNDFIDDSHVLPYTSKMDWKSILKALADIDYKGNFTYEADAFLRPFPDSMLPACERFMHEVGRKMIEEIESNKIKK